MSLQRTIPSRPLRPSGPAFSSMAEQAGVDLPPGPTFAGTTIIVVGMTVTSGASSAETAAGLMQQMAWGAGITLGVSFLVDMQQGIRNVIRADIIALLGLYALCFAEFLFSGMEFYNQANSYEGSQIAGKAVLLALGAFALGRHIAPQTEYSSSQLFLAPVSPQIVVRLFWAAFIIGYINQWLAVDFNPVEWVHWWTGRRWAAPWSRGAIGGWSTILYELSLMQYLITPLSAIIIIRKSIYGLTTVSLVSFVALLNFFHAFSGGTRHIFCVHIIMFTIGLCFFKQRSPKIILLYLSVAFFLMWSTASTMLAFRDMGIKQYLILKSEGASFVEEEGGLRLDYTMQNLNWLMEAMPSRYEHLGWEIPYIALTRPIPRAIWKDKPEGLSVALEEILFQPGASGTWSVTMVGETYMAFGYLGIIGFSVFFGWASNAWNSFGSPKNSDLGLLIFASGFFSFAIAMRSIYTFTTAILPTLAALFFANYLLRNKNQIIPHRAPRVRSMG